MKVEERHIFKGQVNQYIVITSPRYWMLKKQYRYRPNMDGREWKVRTLHQFIHIVLNDLESTCTTEFRAKSKRDMKLNCF